MFSSSSQTVTGRWKEYVSSVTDTINNEILGSEQYPSQWTFPLSENQKGIGTLRLDNDRTRCTIQNMCSLIDISVVDQNRVISWKRTLHDLQKAIDLFRKKKIVQRRN